MLYDWIWEFWMGRSQSAGFNHYSGKEMPLSSEEVLQRQCSQRWRTDRKDQVLSSSSPSPEASSASLLGGRNIEQVV